MDYDGLIQFIQTHFTDGLVIIVGSGLSAAEGIPGMSELADHLNTSASGLNGGDKAEWGRVAALIAAGEGLEAALLEHPPSELLETWISRETCRLLVPKERDVISAVVKGEKTLRMTLLLNRILKPAAGLVILTPNYDRLIEVACEAAGYHVDTTVVGQYAGTFDHQRSCMASCRGITTRGRTTRLDHFPRAVVLKPHGSFDWYRNASRPVRCSVDLDADRLIITPGLNKYRAGYDAPFDKHRDLANDHIKRAARLLVVGYGFNDDHLQTHLLNRIRDGTPTLIITRAASSRVETLARESPACVCISKASRFPGIAAVGRDASFENEGAELWDLGILAKEILE